jgi:hypothetical protein
MKTPRIEDYDPNARERKLQSSMDDLPTIQPRRSRGEKKTAEEEAPPPVRASVRTHARKKTRWPFQIYQDQLDDFKQLARDAEDRGESGSMSEMVREALDDYLRKVKGE